MSAAPLLIIVTGDPIAQTREHIGSFANMVRAGLVGTWDGGYVVLDARVKCAEWPPVEDFAGVIITGSASSVTERAPWMLRLERYLAGAVDGGQAVLGICFGHQILGQALGGLVQRNPRGREMGTVMLTILRDDVLLDRSIEPSLVHVTHVDSIEVLPRGAEVLAATEVEPHAAVRFGDRAWGLQFHPEFDVRIMTDYVQARADLLAGEGKNPAAVLADIKVARVGNMALRRFVERGVLAHTRGPRSEGFGEGRRQS